MATSVFNGYGGPIDTAADTTKQPTRKLDRMPHRHLHLTTEGFARVVERAVARIPAAIRRHLDNVLVSVKERPDPELLEELGMAPDEPLFGVYLGVPLIERSAIDPPLYPDIIYIFQEPLESFCTSREELIEEIEITVVHEIAHMVGFSDEELADLGYG